MNRAFPFRHFVLLGLLGGFLACGSPGAAAASGGDSPGEDLGIHPSEQPQVRQARDVVQTFFNQANGRQAPFEPQAMQPQPSPLFGPVESYLQENSNAWHVILTKLALAGFLGSILALVYRATYTGKRKKYKPSMMQSQLLLAIGGSLVWIIVATSLVRAFGLAGMVGLIRYRTPVRDPKDNVMVFLSMAVGMACGIGQVAVAVVSTAFISLVLFAVHEFRLGKKKKKKKKPKLEAEEVFPEATDTD